MRDTFTHLASEGEGAIDVEEDELLKGPIGECGGDHGEWYE